MIEEGWGLLQASLRRTQGMADAYQLQAAIAYEHDQATTYAETDWDEILRLYDLLLSVAPSAPAALRRAVVLAERDGPEAGLAAWATLPVDSRREAVRSELLALAGRPAEAAAAVSVALAGDAPGAQKRYWRQRLATWQTTSGSSGNRFVQ
jgi:predicted RNA polymerase sigma factor